MFLIPWHNLLVNTLSNKPQKYSKDLNMLNNWEACACSESVGYTLVRRFHSTLINQLLFRVNEILKDHDL